MFGRDGILAHSYLLGPNGESNGCVSIDDYPKFLDAFLNGEIDRIVVVERLVDPPIAKTGIGWLPGNSRHCSNGLELQGARAMPMRRSALLAVGLAGVLLLGGCQQSTLELASDRNLTPRDRQLLARAPYASASIPQSYRRHIVDYHRREPPGTIVVDTDARYLYYVLPQGKAIRYGVTVGEEGLAWSGVARVGRKTEWPEWIPTPEIQARMGPLPARVAGGPANPLGRARDLPVPGQQGHAVSHSWHQSAGVYRPAISSGCIRMTNEDVIDLYDRVKMGATVVVLAPGRGLGLFSRV